MFLFLNTPQGWPGNSLRALAPGSGVLNVSTEDAVKPAKNNAGADFSRVLAGKMDDSPENPSGTERSLSDQVGQRAGLPGEVDGESQTGGGFHQWAWGDQALGTTQALWGGLDGLFPVTDQLVPGGGLTLDPALQKGLPLELRSRLAADIAAQYSNRNGLQTLTMKLNPEHLGQVDVQLQAKGNHLSVRLQVANREAETALRENIKELADSIQKQTGKFQQVDVRVDLKQSENLDRQAQDERSGNSRDDDTNGQTREEYGGAEDKDDTESTDTEPDAGLQGG